MSKEIFNIIKEIRIARGFSQLEVASKLNISRPSYIAIEQGKRELSLAEARKIADIFGIDLEDLESGLAPNAEKYKQMILAYLRDASPADGRIPKTKLAKLLYLADFAWFYDHLQSMSGMPYRKIQYGPVPDVYFRVIDELFEEGKIDVKNTGDGAMLISETKSSRGAALPALNAEEKKLIKNISKKWKDKRTQEIVAFTHGQLPYLVSRDNEIIPYEVITQENIEDVY
jgi:transcriptional regulator with XRE-family HTH domain